LDMLSIGGVSSYLFICMQNNSKRCGRIEMKFPGLFHIGLS